MNFGFDLLDASGSKVVDATLPIFVQVSEGSVYTNTDYRAAYGARVPLPDGLTNCVVAYDIPVGKWLAIKGNVVYAHKDTGRATVPYKIFAQSSQVAPSSDPFGMRIYSASNQLLFDSGKILFNVASYIFFESRFTNARVMTMADENWLIPSVFGLAGIVPVTNNFGDFISPYFYRHLGGRIDSRLKTLDTSPGYDDSEPTEYYCSITEVNIT